MIKFLATFSAVLVGNLLMLALCVGGGAIGGWFFGLFMGDEIVAWLDHIGIMNLSPTDIGMIVGFLRYTTKGGL